MPIVDMPAAGILIINILVASVSAAVAFLSNPSLTVFAFLIMKILTQEQQL